jgi:hypothetical protein
MNECHAQMLIPEPATLVVSRTTLTEIIALKKSA